MEYIENKQIAENRKNSFFMIFSSKINGILEEWRIGKMGKWFVSRDLEYCVF
jgi:hypothetical protein